jgi:DNA-binding transcriptional LysR family regulator
VTTVPAPVTHLNLRLLQTFMLVAEHQSFREAAEQTHRSQSAVSTQIKQLEEQLAIKLLHRTTRSVKLTPEGAELFAGIKRGMHEIGVGSISFSTIR